jgi:predicted MFS family arabinose efflux permease
MGAVFGLGFILGPFIGGKLADPHVYHGFGAATPFWFAAILALTNVALVWWRLPETNTQKRHVVFHVTRSIQNIGKAFSTPKLRGLFTTSFLFISGFTFFTTFFAVFLVKKFGFTEGRVGNYFAYVGIWIAIAQAIVTPFVAKRFSSIAILRYALVITGLRFFGYGLALFLLGRDFLDQIGRRGHFLRVDFLARVANEPARGHVFAPLELLHLACFVHEVAGVIAHSLGSKWSAKRPAKSTGPWWVKMIDGSQ